MARPLPEILAELRASLSEHCPGATPKRLTVEFHNADPFSLPLNGAPAAPPPAAPAVAPTAPPVEAVLTDTQEAIEAVLRLADKPIKVATIASRANKVFNSHFRAEMGRLRRAGRVVVTPEHRYWLADRGKPPA